MNTRGATSDYPGEVLAALATGLAADTVESGRRTLEVVRARSPEIVRISEDTGEDLVATSAGFIDMLLASLRSDLEPPWAEYDERSRSYGRVRAAQGVPLESLIDVLAVYRRATIELISLPLHDSPRRDEIFALAQSRLENVAERLTTSIARGYIDHIDAEHRARENEMFGLAAIVSAMGRSLDIAETGEVALIESLAALRLSTGAIWMRERSSFKVLHTVGLEDDQVDVFTRHAGPAVKAAASAVGRSESRVDRISGPTWNAIRAQLRVRGRTVGMMAAATMDDRLFDAAELLFFAAVADQVGIALDRARQFSNEARTDHLTGLANRREFERVMEREVALSERHGRRLSLMMIDLDNLKGINDRQGHRAGDAALRLVSQQLLRVVRASDLCSRIGGDEFAITMPETSIERARDVASRLHAGILQAGLSSKSPSDHLEVSLGVAAWRPGQDWQAVYEVADADLYEDKRRHKAARRWTMPQPDRPAIRLVGRGGRRTAAGG
jgi:diguanylate cyclase (GGDEF)-like protein